MDPRTPLLLLVVVIVYGGLWDTRRFVPPSAGVIVPQPSITYLDVKTLMFAAIKQRG